MPEGLLSVFVSSTWIDLKAERAAVLEVTHRLRGLHFLGMEFLGSRDSAPGVVSLEEVDRADVYVGIVGGRYGSGITELEYSRAKDRGLPCFIYFKSAPEWDAAPSASESRRDLETFRRRLLERHTCSEFATPAELALKLAADLHNWLFERRIGAGLRRLSTDYASRVQAFVTEYVGGPDRPVPFGGRGPELHTLTEWLADAAAPRYLLIAAGAGKGKSALLVRWARELLTRSDVAPIFFPISIRFRTNLASVVFPSLATYVAALHNEPLNTTPDTPADVWRGVFTDLLARPLADGRRIVIILDGLDEAADWEAGPDLFPPHFSRHGRVVVATRFLAGDADARDWLRRLGWDSAKTARTLTLSPLEQPGVAEVLDHMGLPLAVLGQRTDIVGELHRLSRGEPLLVRLYVDDLWGRGDESTRLRVEDLHTIEPGLAGFFARWWDDQRRLWGSARPLKEQRVQTLMNFLACALGPLTRDDLFELAGPVVDLNTWTLEETLEPLRRFVVGDGLHSGFVYSHPGLAIHFRERLSTGERDTVDARIRAWCVEAVRSAAGGVRRPDQIPSYVVQYLGAHLERAEAPVVEFAPLLTDAWRQGWLAFEGTYAGYRADLRRVQLAATRTIATEGMTAERLTLEMRTALYMASVDQLLANTPPELIVALVEKGVWNRTAAVGFARLIKEPEHRAEALISLAQVLSEPTKSQVFREALEATAAVDVPGQVRLLSAAAGVLPETLVDAALRLARSKNDPRLVAAVIALIPRLSSSQIDDVISMALERTDDGFRQPLLRSLAAVDPDKLCDRAHNDVRLYRFERALILVAASDGAPPHRRNRMLDEAAAYARSAGHDRPPLALLVSVAARLEPGERAAHVEWILGELRKVDYSVTRADTLIMLCTLVADDAREDIVSAALFECARIRSSWDRSSAIVSLAPHLGGHRATAALDLVQGIEYDDVRTSTIVALVPHLPEDCRQIAVQQLLEIADPFDRAEAIAPIAHLVPAAAVAAATALGDVLMGPTARFRILSTMAKLVPASLVGGLLADRLHGLDELSQCAAVSVSQSSRRLGVEARVVSALSSLASPSAEQLEETLFLVGHWAPNASDESLAAAARVILNWKPTRARVALINKLARYLQPALLEEALRQLQTIGDDSVRSRLQAHCLHLLPPALTRERHARAWARLSVVDRVTLLLRWLKDRRFDPETLRTEIVCLIRELKRADACVGAIATFVKQVGTSIGSAEVASLIDAALALDDARERANALAWILPHLDHTTLVRFGEMFAALVDSADEVVHLAIQLARCAPHRTVLAAFTAECHTAADRPQSEQGPHERWNRLLALAKIARLLNEPLRSTAAASLTAALHHADDDTKAAFVTHVAREVDGSFDALFSQCFDIARTIADSERRLQAVLDVLPRIAQPALDAALHATLAWAASGQGQYFAHGRYGLRLDLVEAGAWRAAIVVHCLPHLGAPSAGLWVQLAYQDIGQPDLRVRPDVFAALLPFASPALRCVLASDALERLRSLDDDDRSRIWMLSELVEVLPAPHVSSAVDIALGMIRHLASTFEQEVAAQTVLGQALRWFQRYEEIEALLARLLPTLTPSVATAVWQAIERTGLFSVTRLTDTFACHLPDLALMTAAPSIAKDLSRRPDSDVLPQWAARMARVAPGTVLDDIESTVESTFISLACANLVGHLQGEARLRCQRLALRPFEGVSHLDAEFLVRMIDAARHTPWPALEELTLRALGQSPLSSLRAASKLIAEFSGTLQSEAARIAVSAIASCLPAPGAAAALHGTFAPSIVKTIVDVFLDSSISRFAATDRAVIALLPYLPPASQIDLVNTIVISEWIKNRRTCDLLSAIAQNPDVGLALADRLLVTVRAGTGQWIREAPEFDWDHRAIATMTAAQLIERSIGFWSYAPSDSQAWRTLWNEFIFEARSRGELMEILQQVTPALMQAAGSDALEKTIEAVDDVAAWWP